MQLAIDLLPSARLHDTDTHFYLSKEGIAEGRFSIDDKTFTVMEEISKKHFQRISKDEISLKYLSNHLFFKASQTSLITVGTKERTWDMISVWGSDPKKIPHQFTSGDLEFPIYDSAGHEFPKIRPSCTTTDPWVCLFHIILSIQWLANYIPGQEHPALNRGFFLKICIDTTKGKMFLQNISGVAIALFLKEVSNAEKLRDEVEGKLKHLRKSDETTIAVSLNILNFLDEFIRGKSDYSQIFFHLLPPIGNKKKFHSKLVELIFKYPDRTHEILDVLKGSIIVSMFFNIAQLDDEMDSQVRLTIIDGMPALTYLINGVEGAHFSFKIEAEKTFGRIIKLFRSMRVKKYF